MAGKFEIFRGVDNQYYFRLKAGNGEIILKSEGYTTKQKAEAPKVAVRSVAPYESQYRRYEKPSYYFTLLAWNGEVVGTSETYYGPIGRDTGVASVIAVAPQAPAFDLT